VIYNRVVRPLFLKHQNSVDSFLGKAGDAVSNLASKAAAEAAKKD